MGTISTPSPDTFTALTDSRLEKLLVLAQQMNDILSKIRSATDYLKEDPPSEDAAAVRSARDELVRELGVATGEARELLPVLDELMFKLRDEENALVGKKRLSLGMARIEGLEQTGKQRIFQDEASDLDRRVCEIQNLVKALTTLERDVTSRRHGPVICPRCTSSRVAYRLTPSETGYTLYKCADCSNAWKITEYRITLNSSQGF